jgi:hypothetical protein
LHVYADGWGKKLKDDKLVKLVKLYKDNPDCHIYGKCIKVDFSACERNPALLNILMEKFFSDVFDHYIAYRKAHEGVNN